MELLKKGTHGLTGTQGRKTTCSDNGWSRMLRPGSYHWVFEQIVYLQDFPFLKTALRQGRVQG
jgi:hypothetical protein